MKIKKKSTSLALVFLAFSVLALYFFFDPEMVRYFPGCPIKESTGFDCPGCGSQRALHALLHLNFSEAFRLNPLFILSIPYIFLCVWVTWIRPKNSSSKRWRKRLMGNTSTWIILAMIVLFGILRNVI